MADETVTEPTEEERNDLLLEMAWEMDKIARTIPQHVPVDDDQGYYLVRALVGRMLRLTSVMMDLTQKTSQPDYTFKEAVGMVRINEWTPG